MTVTKCINCPFSQNEWGECWRHIDSGKEFHLEDREILHPECPVNKGRPFEIIFKTINESDATTRISDTNQDKK